jgi:hypothetical protein
VAIVGDVEPRDALARAARRVAALPAGSLTTGIDPGATSPPAAPTNATAAAAKRVIALWRTSGAPDTSASASAARAVAFALRAALTRAPGLEASAHDEGALRDVTWVAVQLEVAPQAWSQLSGTLAGVAAALEPSLISQATARALATERRADLEAGSRLDVTADRLAHARITGGEPAAGDEQAAIATALSLLRATPLVISLD